MVGFQVKGKVEQTCITCIAETGNPPFDYELREQKREQSLRARCAVPAPEI